MGIQLTPEEKFEVFGEDYVDHQDEAEQRWGATDAWKQSQQRAAQYSKEDWVEIKAEGDALNDRIAEAITAGVAPDSAQAMQIAEDHRQHITRRFFEVGYGMHRCMGEMYVADPRFTETYEKVAPGAAAWFRTAVLANADRGEAAAS